MSDFPAKAGRLLDALRAQRPLVQNITNFVSMDVAANALLAIGASPAMVHAPEETPEFVGFSGALVVNIGTLSAPWVEAMHVAASSAHALGKPWALDPVGVGATAFRNHAVEHLVSLKPSLIRGNASEIMAVARIVGIDVAATRPKGVDSANATSEAESAATALAAKLGCVVAATGAMDFVTDGARSLRLANGSPLMERVTALGCALTGVCGAFLAVEKDAFIATAAAIAVYGVAGEMAAAGAAGPGSFRVAFLDRLASVTPAEVAARLKVIA
jgi:hydroxyethylthiazole kinase